MVIAAITFGADAHNTSVPQGYNYYKPTIIADRICLTVTDKPATSIKISWRTDDQATVPRVQIGIAQGSPDLEAGARTLTTKTAPVKTDNGTAHHHHILVNGLTPNTLYAYRVMGAFTWSEWFQFRTASDESCNFSFIYFGDAQNALKSYFSRVIRQAYADMPEAAFMIHAGDLVNSRDGNHDDEWGEWFDAGGWLYGMVPSIPASGNHEHVKTTVNGKEVYQISPLWNAHFSLPQNGPKKLLNTAYYLDYQNVRFIVLNSQSAVDSTVPEQASWLETVLKNNPCRWTIVIQHHPMFSVSLGRDNSGLRQMFKSVFEKYKVDLVLQGHDHTYGRTNEPQGSTVIDRTDGTVYVVSVAGPKLYLVSDVARETMTRVGEGLQLYQHIQVTHDRIKFSAKTADGKLYDGFTLIRKADGSNRIEEILPQVHDCSRPMTPGESRKNCFSGLELNMPPAGESGNK